MAPVRREPLGGQSRDTHGRTTSPKDAPDEVRSQPGTGGEARQLRIARAGVHAVSNGGRGSAGAAQAVSRQWSAVS